MGRGRLTRLLDASALLASLLDEPGRERIDADLPGSVMSAVNWAEVAGRLRARGATLEEVRQALQSVPITVIAADADLALEAGDLRPITTSAGLSLGDRFCLALARRLRAPVLTADRSWARVADLVGVEIELIR